jgi:glycine betaine transporter
MKLLGKVDKTIFGITVVLYLSIFLFILLLPETAAAVISGIMDFTLNTVGFVYILGYAFIIIVFLGIAFSKYGKLRLGKDDEKPEYSFFAWMGMLFTAGLGVGIVFFGVTEPVSHFMQAPFAESGTAEAASDAMFLTFFHWSFLPWASYGIVGLCMAFFLHRKGLPTLMSSSFHPTLGDRINRTPGKIIDAFSLIALICGLSMSLGYAATQFSTGMNLQYGVPDSFLIVCIVTAVIAVVAIASALSGVGKGIKFLSNINVYIVIFFLVFTFIFGPTAYLIKSFIQGFGDLFANLPWLMFYLDAYNVTEANVGYNWTGGWTIMYWAWWVSFIPYVSGFLASISKGRTIREYVIACTVVPGLLCCMWFAFFGGGAIGLDLFHDRGIGEVIVASVETSLFVYLAELPLAAITIPIAMFLVVFLITTSVNSASYVAGQYSSGGDYIPPLGMRAFWGIFIVLNAILFIFIGGLPALRNATIAIAFPVMIIVILMVLNLLKELKSSHLPSP